MIIVAAAMAFELGPVFESHIKWVVGSLMTSMK